MTLTEFLLARLAEDETLARAAQRAWPTVGSRGWDDVKSHIARQAPARVLADMESKRRIVEALDAAFDANSANPSSLGAMKVMGLLDACYILASVYSDHPDFNPDWAV